MRRRLGLATLAIVSVAAAAVALLAASRADERPPVGAPPAGTEVPLTSAPNAGSMPTASTSAASRSEASTTAISTTEAPTAEAPATAASTVPTSAAEREGLGERPAASDFMRGIVVSCPRAGQIWGSPQMTEALRKIRPLGANWVAIHPYAGVRRDGSIRNWFATDSGYLPNAAKRVRDEKMSLFWKPHLAYWGSFSWRGEIEFQDEAAWQRFFTGYREFIVDQARFAERERVPLFAVGVELDKTLHREKEWRRIIAEIREVYRGEILYAANWDAIDRVPFWDALDSIGVHAYFPLADREDTPAAEIRKALRRHLDQLDALSKQHGNKRIVLAEIGYTRSAKAAIEPWAYGTTDTPGNRELRKTLIEIAIEEIEQRPAISGMFWWKWIPGNDRWDRDFSMKDPEAADVLQRMWAPAETAR